MLNGNFGYKSFADIVNNLQKQFDQYTTVHDLQLFFMKEISLYCILCAFNSTTLTLRKICLQTDFSKDFTLHRSSILLQAHTLHLKVYRVVSKATIN